MKALHIEQNIKVCTYDIDFAGHVSNIVYLRWLEEMRLAMFDKYCPLQGFMERGMTPILTATEIKYKKSIRLFDKPKAFMWVSDVGKASFAVEAEFYLNGELTTTARHTGVFVDMQTMKPIRLPKDFLDCLSENGALMVAPARTGAVPAEAGDRST